MLDDHVTAGLAREAADLLSIADGADVRSLHRLSELAVRQVAGCSGATAALWRDGEPVQLAATHPDLSALFDLCREAGTGPWPEALATSDTVYCADTLEDDRWPDYAREALQRGVRCSVTLVHIFGPMTVTLTLFGARPRALDPGKVGVAELLIAFGGATLGNASIYGETQRTAHHLRESAESRMVVDQAKGILMHALGCTAAEAFDRMREISQTRHVKVTDVAATIIKAHRSVGQPGAGEPGPADPAAVPGSESPGPGQPTTDRRARGSRSGQAATRKPSASRSSAKPAPRRPPGSDRS
ncbi:MAG TPA: ANTAR domain-containing protein [Streptosporangiaceae bacterium]|nr:ANTAR domain-containing protein [Streptosporangiaceae bacterium]